MAERGANGNPGRRKTIRRHTDLEVFQAGFEAAMKVFEMTRHFPAEERFSLTDQIRRSSRSVCSNVTEAWRKRRYPAAFVSKLNDAEAEAAETQTWLQFSVKCRYIEPEVGRDVYRMYDGILGKLVNMIRNQDDWSL